MIRYALACDAGHRFESWFGDSAAFDGLAARGLVSCPLCGSARVAKTIMAPAVARHAAAKPASAQSSSGTSSSATSSATEPSSAEPPAAGPPAGAPDDAGRELRALMRAVRSKVLAGTKDVGARFPVEARRMHDGDIPHADIRGEATLEEARALLEDGIMIMPVPGEPGELN